MPVAARTFAYRFSLALLVLSAAGVTFWHLRTPTRSVQDDGYYYFQIARNIAHGAGSSFDGVNPTNGYQPLWLGMLVPIFWMAPSSLEALRIGIVLQGIAFAALLAILFETARLRYGYAASLFAAFLWLLFAAQESFSGLEFSIHALAIGVIGYLYLARFGDALPEHRMPFFLLGLACSLAFLARIDSLALHVVLGLVLVAQGLRERKFVPENWAAFAAPLLVTVSVYTLFNLVFFGHPLPVSAVVKESWSRILLTSDPVYASYGWLAAKIHNFFWAFDSPLRAFPIYVVFGTFGAGVLWIGQHVPTLPQRWRKGLARATAPLTPFILYGVVNYAAFALMLHRNLSWTPWYYVIQPWLTVILAAAALDALGHAQLISAKLARVIQVAAFLVALAPLVLVARQLQAIDRAMQVGERPNPLLTGAEWAHTHLANNAVIGSWNAGTIGYLSERRTVNLDGVVNSFAYFERDRFDLCGYWKAQGVTYLIDAFEGDRALSVVPTLPAYAACASLLGDIWSDTRYDAAWRLQVYRLTMP